ncbi:DNA repair helicase XPB [uncultured Brachyspira sp.]|uniref:DNA repair helicase XPB n=1 Tax=uncultured Brachyspira sp. TaxID=221953 RepID=UPI002633FF9D|nr:DNA repair helicase XPB [uncultured Brachyspira sp.]
MDKNAPLIVQGDGTILLDVSTKYFEEIRNFMLVFAELVKSPEYIHTYRITLVSLWNAASLNYTSEQIIGFLKKYTSYEIPKNIIKQIESSIEKYGRIKIIKEDERYYLISEDKNIIDEILHYKAMIKYIKSEVNENKLEIDPTYRGHIKLALINIGYPVQDLAGYKTGEPYHFNLREKLASSGDEFALRDYQKNSVEAFYADGKPEGGAGVIALPCGTGKTVVGIAAMHKTQTKTLIIVTGVTACRQWRDEILDKTDIPPEDIGEYNGLSKEIKPITIATYKILTYRKNKESPFVHFELFFQHNWGLIIYDEVHLLPAPIIKLTSEIQSMRRLGLTATLVREDGLEKDVFCLIGPKKFDIPWRELEEKKFIAEAYCYDIRIPLDDSHRSDYVVSSDKVKFRIASENVLKYTIVKKIIEKLKGKNILIIGQYLDQLDEMKNRTGYTIITGKTPQSERDIIYKKFKTGKITTLIVSKVANLAVDLPDANVLIQISGTFGSRQEEAQRLGRVLRPKKGENKSYFFSIITTDTKEEDFAHKRQLFLTEQGYHYELLDKDSFEELEFNN